jgi:3-phenylpropionate/trans-cinnamate dioxygenase ferredoxin subunit
LADSNNWLYAASLSTLSEQRRLKISIDGVEVLLCLVGGEPVAIRNYCTHLGKPLEKGRIMAGQIHCPFHGACFDLKTGEAKSGPAVSPLQRFALLLHNDDIMIALPNPKQQN